MSNNTINKKEIEKFNKIAEEWWDPDGKFKPLHKFTPNDYKIKIEKKIIDDKLKEISEQNKQYEDKKDNEKALNGDQITFDYIATVDGNKFEGSEGKGVQIELGKNLMSRNIEDTKDIAKVETHPKFEGRQMIMIIQPN